MEISRSEEAISEATSPAEIAISPEEISRARGAPTSSGRMRSQLAPWVGVRVGVGLGVGVGVGVGVRVGVGVGVGVGLGLGPASEAKIK